MALELKVGGVTVTDRTTSERADHDAVLGEDLLGWAAYLMNAATSSARELVQAASVLMAAAHSEVDPRQRASQVGGAELRNGHAPPGIVQLMRRALEMSDDPVAA
jgi:hypothetical protein